ncbi:MAG: efflux RND transporter permease subunit [Bacteroidales bacterium]
MSLSSLSIKRPVFATMMVVTLLVFGLYSFKKLNYTLMPDIVIPWVSINTGLEGASPDEMETEITSRIENAVYAIKGVEHITSSSGEGYSHVQVQFKQGINPEQAAALVRERVATQLQYFPEETNTPIVQTFEPANAPIIGMAVSGPDPPQVITRYIGDYINRILINLDGVGSVRTYGGVGQQIQIICDLNKLKAYNISINDVITAVGAANVDIPGGVISEEGTRIQLTTLGKIKNFKDFGNVVVSSSGGKNVYVSDLGVVRKVINDVGSYSRINGFNAIGIDILKQSGTNTVNVAKEVIEALKDIRADLPPGYSIEVIHNDSDYILEEIDTVFFDLVFGAFLTVMLIFLFLGNVRSTVISAVALPISVISTFSFMLIFDFTLNLMTLLALSLAIGLLIDDAIVVIENIYRHMKMGKTPKKAAADASNEIGLAVLATTLTIVAVFIPVAFMSGTIGQVFNQFGLTISISVLVSMFVAFSTTPMMSSKYLKDSKEGGDRFGNLFEKIIFYFNHFFDLFGQFYQKALRWSLIHRGKIILISVIILVITYVMFTNIKKEYFPVSDTGQFDVNIAVAPGSDLDQTNKYTILMEEMLQKDPDVKLTYANVGGPALGTQRALIHVQLVDKKERKEGIQEIVNSYRNKFNQIPGVDLNFSIVGGATPGPPGKPLVTVVRGDDYNRLSTLADTIMDIYKSIPGIVDVQKDLNTNNPQYQLSIDRLKAYDLGLNPQLLATTIRNMVSGQRVTYYNEGKYRYQVRVQLRREDKSDLNKITSITVKSANTNSSGNNFLIPISEVTKIHKGYGPEAIRRYDRLPAVTVNANLGNLALSQAQDSLAYKLKLIELPKGYYFGSGGDIEQQQTGNQNIALALTLAIILVYIVMAAQFESYLEPFVIMFSLPLTLIGALIFLYIFGSSLSMVSYIGILLLMGLATKNAILLINYANQMRNEGKQTFEALMLAGKVRLRPILMTTLAMILGMTPVAFANSAGSAARAPMGQAVIGGLISSTLLTLIIIPVIYSLLDDFLLWIKRKLRLKPRKI